MAQRKPVGVRAVRFARAVSYVYPRCSTISPNPPRKLQKNDENTAETEGEVGPPAAAKRKSSVPDPLPSPPRPPRPQTVPTFKQWSNESRWRKIMSEFFEIETCLEIAWEINSRMKTSGCRELVLFQQTHLRLAWHHFEITRRHMITVYGDMEVEEQKDLGFVRMCNFCDTLVEDCGRELQALTTFNERSALRYPDCKCE